MNVSSLQVHTSVVMSIVFSVDAPNVKQRLITHQLYLQYLKNKLRINGQILFMTYAPEKGE